MDTRKISRNGMIVMTFLLMVTFPLRAVAADDEITLEKALGQFYANNYDLLIHKYEIDKAEADFIRAKLLPNPTFSFNATGLETNNLHAGDNTQRTFRLDQLIELGGKRGLRTSAAEESLEAARLSHKDTIRTLLAGFLTLFYNLKLDTLNLEFATEELKRHDRILEIAEKRFDAGHLSLVDYTKIKISRIDLENGLTNAENQVRNDIEQFRFLIGGTGPLKPVLSIEDHFPSYDEEELIAGAYNRRYDLLSLQKQQKAADHSIVLAKRTGWMPDVTVGAEYESYGSQNDPGVGVGFSFSLPLFNRNQGEIIRRNAEYKQIEIQIKKLKQQIAVDVKQAVNNFRASTKVLASYAGRKAEIEDLLVRSEKAFTLGGITAFDLLDTRKIYRDFKSKYVQALVQSNLNEELIKISSGEIK